MTEDRARPSLRTPMPDEARIRVLLEEYRALYALLTFRLSAMDRRLPVAGGTLWGLLATIPAMPGDTQLPFLLGFPAALLWLLLSTAQHAKSKEDHLRRIDEIERLINALAGEELLVFQSRHPNTHARAAGRTGYATVLGLFSACSIMLVGCGFLAFTTFARFSQAAAIAFHAYSAMVWVLMAAGVIGVRRYRYRRPPRGVPPLFETRPAEGLDFADFDR